jgi:peptidoglycan/LPS O-acetylase OafA/YrhL
MFCYQYERTQDWAAPLIAATARGWIGVPIFFVISGFCIAATADSARRRGLPVADYFKRRFRRIFPPYWATMGLVAGCVLLLWPMLSQPMGYIEPAPNPLRLTPAQWFGNVTLTETWRPCLFGGPGRWLVGQAWTLAYEEQFYAVTGLLLLVARRRFYEGVAVVSAVVLVLCSSGLYRFGVFWDGRWLLFAAGIGIYWSIGRGDWLSRVGLSVLFLVALAYGARDIGALREYAWSSDRPDGKEVVVAAAFALALLWLHPLDSQLSNSWLAQPFAFCGRICYSLYLTHYVVVLAISHALYRAGFTSPAQTATVTLPLCMAAAITVGSAFYWAVECHFLNPPTSPAPATVP